MAPTAPLITLSLFDDPWHVARARPPRILDIEYRGGPSPLCRMRVAEQPRPSRKWPWEAFLLTLRDAVVERRLLAYTILRPDGPPYGTEEAWVRSVTMTGQYELLTEPPEEVVRWVGGVICTRVDTVEIELLPEPAFFREIYQALRTRYPHESRP